MLFIGCTFNAWLFGIACFQYGRYISMSMILSYCFFPLALTYFEESIRANDSIFIHIMVALLLICDLVYTCGVIWMVWEYLYAPNDNEHAQKTNMLSFCFRVVNYANPSALTSTSSLHCMNFLVLIFIL